MEKENAFIISSKNKYEKNSDLSNYELAVKMAKESGK